jgi:hypothetical protein
LQKKNLEFFNIEKKKISILQKNTFENFKKKKKIFLCLTIKQPSLKFSFLLPNSKKVSNLEKTTLKRKENSFSF